MYSFTAKWFDDQKPTIETYFPPTHRKLRILEIGAFEGRSSVFYIDNYLSHPESTIDIIDPFDIQDKTTPYISEIILDRFLGNIKVCKYPEKVTFHRAYTNKILPKMIMDNKKFDYIAIDGSHLMEDVLHDCVQCYELLDKNGVMFMDDYHSPPIRLALDSFMNCYSSKMEKIHAEMQLVAKKKN